MDVPAGANHHVTVYPDPGEGTLAVQVQDASGGVVAVGVAGYGGAVSALWTNSSSGPQQVFVWITLAADAGSTPGTSYAIENFVY